MKTTIRIFILTWAMVLFASINTVSAEERLDEHEMGESGLTVSFSMTPAEITAEDAAIKKRTAGKNKSSPSAFENRVSAYELPESGNFIVFPEKRDGVSTREAVALTSDD